MSFVSHDFDYMPKGSYAVTPEGEILYLQPLPEDLKKRFEEDLQQKKAQWEARLKYDMEHPDEQHFF